MTGTEYDDDEYPPYTPYRPTLAEMAGDARRDERGSMALVTILLAALAGVAVGGLLIAYGYVPW